MAKFISIQHSYLMNLDCIVSISKDDTDSRSIILRDTNNTSFCFRYGCCKEREENFDKLEKQLTCADYD